MFDSGYKYITRISSSEDFLKLFDEDRIHIGDKFIYKENPIHGVRRVDNCEILEYTFIEILKYNEIRHILFLNERNVIIDTLDYKLFDLYGGSFSLKHDLYEETKAECKDILMYDCNLSLTTIDNPLISYVFIENEKQHVIFGKYCKLVGWSFPDTVGCYFKIDSAWELIDNKISEYENKTFVLSKIKEKILKNSIIDDNKLNQK